jgi:hypothetical protein
MALALVCACQILVVPDSAIVKRRAARQRCPTTNSPCRYAARICDDDRAPRETTYNRRGMSASTSAQASVLNQYAPFDKSTMLFARQSGPNAAIP